MKSLTAFTATIATGAAVAAAALLGAGPAAAAPAPGAQNGTVHADPTGDPSHRPPQHRIFFGNLSGQPLKVGGHPDRR